jgi:hypothetical protein
MLKVDLLLADTARIAEGKLDALGIGWAVILPGGAFTVCGVVHIPWDQAAERHSLLLELVDGDGEAFYLPDQDEPFQWQFHQDQPLRATVQPHVKPGTTLTWPFLLNIGVGFPLEPGTLYAWRLSVDGHHEEIWTLPFRTLPAAPVTDDAA